jgi:hypothetical protein
MILAKHNGRVRQVAQQSVTELVAMIATNLVTPKAGAKHELCSMNRPQRWVC